MAELGETLQEYAPHLKKTLQEAGGLILLDGLDEVPDAGHHREQVKGAVQNRLEAVAQLEKLQAELSRAIEAGVLEEETATDAEYQVKKAVQQAKKPEPDKKSILEHLNEAKALIEGVAAAAGLVGGLAQAAALVQQLF